MASSAAAAPSLADTVKQAADRQLSLEGTYAGGDLAGIACSWEWQVTTNQAYANTQGPSGLGLLEAFEAFHKPAYLGNASTGAICAGNQMMARDSATSDRVYAQDIVFLFELSENTHNSVYRNAAIGYFARTIAAYPTGDLLADHYIDARFSLSGWDLAAQIMAAKLAGQNGYARDIAQRLIDRRAEWEGVLYGGYDYTLLSHAALIQAMGGIFSFPVWVYRAQITQDVLNQQDLDDGSWADQDFQTTAFALMGLETLPQTPAIRQAISLGAGFLQDTQDDNGGWVYPADYEYGEVNGEVLTALAPLVRSGFGRFRHGRRFIYAIHYPWFFARAHN